MRIAQDVPKFKPITITLETREEAEAMWKAIRSMRNVGEMPSEHLAFYINLCNWFSNEGRL